MNPAFWLLIIMGICFLLNVPIAFSLGIAALSTVLITNIIPVARIPTLLVTSGDSFPLLAVPFFILAGEIMCTGGISKRLVSFSQSIFGGVTGSLGMITVFSCAIFASMCGSSPATVAAIGGIMVPSMVKQNYEPEYASVLTAAGGTLGPVIPPSIVYIMYGVVTGTSVGDLFLAGVLPGIFICATLMVTTHLMSKKHGFGIKSDEKTSVKKILIATKEAFWALTMPVILLGGIYAGVFTPTEAAAVSCAYGLIIGLFVYKELKFKDLWGLFSKTGLIMGSGVVVLGFAIGLGQVLTFLGVPFAFRDFMLRFTESKIVVLLMCNILLLIAGMFMETISIVLILAPLLTPIVVAYGVNPVHFGIIMTFNLVIGQLTPPTAINLFIASQLFNVQIVRMLKWLPWFLGVMIFDLIIITYIPTMSLALISLLR